MIVLLDGTSPRLNAQSGLGKKFVWRQRKRAAHKLEFFRPNSAVKAFRREIAHEQLSLSNPKEFLDLPDICRSPIIRQTLHKYPSVLFLQNAVVQQRQQPAIMQ